MSAKPFGSSIRPNGPVSFDRVRVACAPHGGWTIHMPKRADASSRPDR